MNDEVEEVGEVVPTLAIDEVEEVGEVQPTLANDEEVGWPFSF
jgi:hypothetical protein